MADHLPQNRRRAEEIGMRSSRLPLLSPGVDMIEEARRLPAVRVEGEVQELVRRAISRLTHADWTSFVLPDGNTCALGGEVVPEGSCCKTECQRAACIAAWAVSTRRIVAISDVLTDERTATVFEHSPVRSLLLVPVSSNGLIAVLGAYWKAPDGATHDDAKVLLALAHRATVTLRDMRLFAALSDRRSPLNGPP